MGSVTLPARLADMSAEWLRAVTSGYPRFADDPIQSFTARPLAEGIGQMGEFALLNAELASGERVRIFAKGHTAVESMSEVSRAAEVLHRCRREGRGTEDQE